MTNWQTKTIVPEDGDPPITVSILGIPDFFDLEIIHESNGRFYVEAVHSCDGEIEIGTADNLGQARQMAVLWVTARAQKILDAVGTAGDEESGGGGVSWCRGI